MCMLILGFTYTAYNTISVRAGQHILVHRYIFTAVSVETAVMIFIFYALSEAAPGMSPIEYSSIRLSVTNIFAGQLLSLQIYRS